jgi:hypothetical protein
LTRGLLEVVVLDVVAWVATVRRGRRKGVVGMVVPPSRDVPVSVGPKGGWL